MTKAAHRLMEVQGHKVGELWQPGVRGYHSAVGCLVMALDTGNFSFQLRSPTSDTPNTYGSWGGSVDGAEDLMNALRRELREETGYDGPWTVLPLSVSNNKPGFKYYNHLVTVPNQFVVNPGAEFKGESQGDVWVPYGEWPAPLHPGLKQLLEDKQTQFTLEQALKRRARTMNIKVNAAQRLLACLCWTSRELSLSTSK